MTAHRLPTLGPWKKTNEELYYHRDWSNGVVGAESLRNWSGEYETRVFTPAGKHIASYIDLEYEMAQVRADAILEAFEQGMHWTEKQLEEQ